MKSWRLCHPSFFPPRNALVPQLAIDFFRSAYSGHLAVCVVNPISMGHAKPYLAVYTWHLQINPTAL